MDTKQLRGTGTAIVTPFTMSGEIDYEATKNLLEYQLDGGVEMIVPLGSTGENPTITAEERRRFLEFVIETIDGRALVIAGTGVNDTRQSVANTKEAAM